MGNKMINVQDVQYIRLRAPDLDKMETFLSEFGMHRSARTDKALYMRGTDAEHTVHITELGEPAFLGMAFNAASEVIKPSCIKRSILRACLALI